MAISPLPNLLEERMNPFAVEEHNKNAALPMPVTLYGMVISVKEVHPWNAASPILMTLSGMVKPGKEKHCINAAFPILASPFDRVTLPKEVHVLNASLPMLVTLPGMVTSMLLLFKYRVIVACPLEIV